jgi:hypothetical protein
MLLLSLAVTAQAQSLKVGRVGEIVSEDGTARFVNPSTTIVVDATLRCETIKRGEYARYAQRYLGVIAPLADRQVSTVTDVRILWSDTDTPESADAGQLPHGTFDVSSHLDTGAEFMRVLPDRTSTATRTEEQAAREAADMIFSIRRRRFELVSGDMGENVYGGGLGAALERLDMMENQYMELFLGRHSVETRTERFHIVPETGDTSIIFARWNAARGFLPVDDLSGEPVVLQLNPQGVARATYIAPNGSPRRPRGKGGLEAGYDYAVADPTLCRVVIGDHDYGHAVIPVYQMGVRISR